MRRKNPHIICWFVLNSLAFLRKFLKSAKNQNNFLEWASNRHLPQIFEDFLGKSSGRMIYFALGFLKKSCEGSKRQENRKMGQICYFSGISGSKLQKNKNCLKQGSNQGPHDQQYNRKTIDLPRRYLLKILLKHRNIKCFVVCLVNSLIQCNNVRWCF